MLMIVCLEKRQNTNICNLKGVGEKRASLLYSAGIRTVEDALTYFPRRHEDQTVVKKIKDLKNDDNVSVIARLISDIEMKRFGKSKTLTKAVFKDETGVMQGVWFNSPYIKNFLKRYSVYTLYGKVTIDTYGTKLSNPKITEYDQNKPLEILPVYPLVKGIRQHDLRKVIEQSLEIYKDKLAETLPGEIKKKRGLIDIWDAIESMHSPKELDDIDKARKRLAYEELFYLQTALLSIKNETKVPVKKRRYTTDQRIGKFTETLLFELTKAQKNAVKEVFEDMDSDKTMNRLLQGDVGSGKTIVALLACLKAVYSGYQCAVMVPTSVLALQHHKTFNKLLMDTGLRIGLLYSGLKSAEKKDILKCTANGDIDILIGTHSLIREDVEFKDLGLVITDEQHRFGVDQRFRLSEKGDEPDKLILTATPIPRTLGMIIYGDTDISVINELPPGRKPVETYLVDTGKRNRVFAFIQKNINEGRQVFIICPLVEESELMELESVTEYFDKAKKIFPEYSIQMLHGKLRPDEKESILSGFANGNTNILISTTVIEIGIDVPNANIIFIENAERYGLAQLHQLRGRVGRGDEKAYCIMMSDSENPLTKKRIKVLTESNDGFYISEMDLKLRGPGDFFGTLQHGIPEMKVANLYEDIGLLHEAQEDLKAIADKSIMLSDDERSIISRIVGGIRKDMIDA